MAGSSAPPSEIWNKFNKPLKRASLSKRRVALSQMRQSLTYCQECTATWELNPAVLYLDILQRLTGMSKLLPIFPESEQQDLAAGIHTVKLTADAVSKRGHPPELLQEELGRLRDRLLMAERQARLDAGEWNAPTSLQVDQIQTPEQMQEYLNELIRMGAMSHIGSHAWSKLEDQAEALGIYLPPHWSFHKSDKHRYRPAIFLLFGFQPPRCTKEEHQLIHSPLFKQHYHRAADRWHADKHPDDPKVAAYWWHLVNESYQIITESRKKRLGVSLPIESHQEFLTRSPEQLVIHAPAPSRGLLLEARNGDQWLKRMKAMQASLEHDLVQNGWSGHQKLTYTQTIRPLLDRAITLHQQRKHEEALELKPRIEHALDGMR